MIQFNLIARIADDKNHFADFIHAVCEAKNSLNIDVYFTFVGAVQNEGLYKSLMRMAELLKVDHLVHFTKESIKYNDLPEHLKKGYFINYCVGNSIGYSSIESIKQGFKTVFYNVDDRWIHLMTPGVISFCRDQQDLLRIIKEIDADKAMIDRQIEQENNALLPHFSLTKQEAELLIGTMV